MRLRAVRIPGTIPARSYPLCTGMFAPHEEDNRTILGYALSGTPPVLALQKRVKGAKSAAVLEHYIESEFANQGILGVDIGIEPAKVFEYWLVQRRGGWLEREEPVPLPAAERMIAERALHDEVFEEVVTKHWASKGLQELKLENAGESLPVPDR